jgi:molybdate transport system substrate-binding protein
MHTRHAGVALVLLTCFLIGCGSKDRPQPTATPKAQTLTPTPADELIILAGSSFLPPTEQLIAEFGKATGIKITYTTGGSEDLLPHVKDKLKGDIFITHDPYMEDTKKAGSYADHVEVGFVAPVLAVQKGNPKGLKGVDDLTQPGLKVALSNPQYSTSGEMVEALLKKKGIQDAVMKNVDTRLTKGHSNLGNFLKTQAVDAVILWNGVAHTFKEHIDVIKTPYEYDTEIKVHVIGLSYSKQPEAVRKFMVFVRENGPRIFAENGYVK